MSNKRHSARSATLPAREIRAADEVWVATALLHRENPERSDFSVREIVERAREELLAGHLRPSIYVHALQHCVANRAPSPARYCILFETGRLTRRLYRPGDPCHPDRAGGKTIPQRDQLPAAYHPLWDWWHRQVASAQAVSRESDPILALRGLGKEIWEGVDPDEYVRQLREGWD